MIVNPWIDFALRIAIGSLLALYLYQDARRRDYFSSMWIFSPVILLFVPLSAALVMAAAILFAYFFSRPKGELVHCPHCKRKIHHILAFCPFCRRSVKRECLRCHETAEWDATICPHCRSTQLTEL